MFARLAMSLLAAMTLFLAAGARAEGPASLRVEGTQFVVAREGAQPLTSHDLVGAVMAMTLPEGGEVEVRIDGVEPDPETPAVLLHRFSYRNASGAWVPFCQKDAKGRSMGFPVAGAWKGQRFVADAARWFVTCTSGSQGKCMLFGYDPWKRGPHGEDLVPYYEACQHMMRADYLGDGTPHTKDGTMIAIWDHLGVQRDEPLEGSVFEAGWAPGGAVCVARTRWADLLTTEALHRAAPRLAGKCDETAAKAKGAILFTRVR